MSTLNGNFVWSIADQLRGPYKPHQYGTVILPFTILRRLDCQMAPHRDAIRALVANTSNPQVLASLIKSKTGLGFHNTSEYTLEGLLSDPDGLRDNLIDYTNSFSSNIDVFERFKFSAEVATLEEKDRLYLVASRFAEIDLSTAAVDNAQMGDLFETLIRKFAAASNEEAGEHYTPRDAIRLMVELLFAEDNEALLKPGTIRSVYDPTAGTGGMLSLAEDHLLAMNPRAEMVLYGQEHNDQSYAICKSDMISKGQDSDNIQLGDTLADDKFAGKTFDYCMSNPPYGVDWKASADAIKKEVERLGRNGRFGAGLPNIGDGQMLFLTHLAHKMRPPKIGGDNDGGGRAGVVLNGSPFFNGAAESGESKIRRSLLESDLVEAIVALPTNMFFNTGISTYIWILDNTKSPERRGKVQLIDGSSFFIKMRKSLGNKSREIGDTDRERIVSIYDAFDEQRPEDEEFSRVFVNTDFGYWNITVERPLRLAFQVTPERLEAVIALTSLKKGPLAKADPAALRSALEALGEERWTDRAEFLPGLRSALKDAGLRLAAPAVAKVWQTLSERDEGAEICYDSRGNPEPDSTLRDAENIPFGWAEAGVEAEDGSFGDSGWGRDNQADVIEAYFEHEVRPHSADAWIDQSKTKIGYEIPFTRHFHRYVPPRPLREIDADLDVLVAEIITLLQEVGA